MKILEVVYSYNEILFKEKNFEVIVDKMYNTLALWKWRNLTLSGKITIFKTMALSKIDYVALLSCTPSLIIDQIEDLLDDFLWNGKNLKLSTK